MSSKTQLLCSYASESFAESFGFICTISVVVETGQKTFEEKLKEVPSNFPASGKQSAAQSDKQRTQLVHRSPPPAVTEQFAFHQLHLRVND